ncbi:sensor histidine kinase [Chitinophaga parva]|uniref:sensor histidine kinase n=1 Tax=Chitinophaga parva TaxID=2169414 RepID=UPI001403811B|nr:histidine kinase [Chitinophaga parva]
MEDYIHKKGWLFTLPPLFISTVLLAMLIYVNAFLLIPQLLDRKKTAFYLLSVLLLVILNTYLKSLSQQHYDTIVWPKEVMKLPDYFKWNLFNSVWSILISTLLLFSLRWSEQKDRVKNIEVEQLHIELKYLRSQVNPHFLFNGLNTIYGNIDIKDQKARDILLQFSGLLRYSLYEADADFVPLTKEASYIENYVALQKARSNSNLRVTLDMIMEDGHVKIAPLLFMPFLENAFKFSASDEETENRIAIRLVQKDKHVLFECTNTCNDDRRVSGGIGLANVRRRLDLLYGKNYVLETKNDAFNYYVMLNIII